MGKLTVEQIKGLRDNASILSGRMPLDPRDVTELCNLALAALGGGWQPIETAPKDKTPILGVLRRDLVAFTGREDLDRWAGVQGCFRHIGLADDGFDIGWQVAAPVGHGGFPDSWFEGWQPLPSAPSDCRR